MLELSTRQLGIFKSCFLYRLDDADFVNVEIECVCVCVIYFWEVKGGLVLYCRNCLGRRELSGSLSMH